MTDLLLFTAGLIGLLIGGNQLIKGAARLASAFGISPLIIGLTVVALGTSAPELLVALNAASSGASDLAMGNVVGSNIANIGLILAISALIFPMMLDWRIFRREIPLMIGFSVLVLILCLDGEIGRLDGLLLVGSFIIFTSIIYRQAQKERKEIQPELDEFERQEDLIDKTHPLREAGRTTIGLVILVISSQILVDAAVNIARGIGVSELIIGVTMVAVGTSLPELVACVIASTRRENDIVIGNVIGSNVSNLLIILGVVALIQPIPVDPSLLGFELPVMIGFAALMLPLALRRQMGRGMAVVYLAAYSAFIVLTLI
ncbi:MAG: calcium/sodium antiporter [Anaerolinea sp.]|nr:calcium/sodium antiporter [Anaerolinea sp.]